MGESFQKLNLTNAYLFAAALQDEEICRNLLEIVLNKEISRVKAHMRSTHCFLTAILRVCVSMCMHRMKKSVIFMRESNI